MASFNKVILIGNITKDIELKVTPSGTQVASFTVAVGRPKCKDGQQKTDFINVVTFNKTAENVSKFCGKGSPIVVEGKLQTRSYEAQDGSKRYATEVMADTVTFLGKREESERTEQDERPAPTATFTDVSDEEELPF